MGLSINLIDRVVLVTGAGRGLGRGCVEMIVQAGARVIAVSRTGQIEDFAADLRDRIEVWNEDVLTDHFLQRVSELTYLHGLVCNAGYNRPAAFEAVSRADLDGMWALNVRAAFLTAQAATPPMRRAERASNGARGAMLFMSSQMGHVGSPSRSVYCLTKHALEGLCKALALELAPHGIRALTICPTFIATEMTRPMLDDPEFARFVVDRIPLGRLGTVEEVACAVAFLLSPLAGLITGSAVLADGGWTAQ